MDFFINYKELLWLTLKADAPLTYAPRAHGMLAGKKLR